MVWFALLVLASMLPWPEAGRARAASPQAALPFRSSGVSGTAGFDRCGSTSVRQMKAFYKGSPYRDVGIYLGGPDMASCFVPDTAWTRRVHAIGYSFIPIWVGRQAPDRCNGRSYPYYIGLSKPTAYAQGAHQAGLAVASAKGAGFGPGSIIYNDLEGYDTTDSGCRTAVKAYVNGWVQQLHTSGYPAGMYGSTCASAVSDWAEVSNVPDDVWLANWNRRATVWNVSCVGNSLWNGLRDRRLKQFLGNYRDRRHGVTLVIDADCQNGLVSPSGHGDGRTADAESLGGTVEDPRCRWRP